jgi:hypothetical protein
MTLNPPFPDKLCTGVPAGELMVEFENLTVRPAALRPAASANKLPRGKHSYDRYTSSEAKDDSASFLEDCQERTVGILVGERSFQIFSTTEFVSNFVPK